jgi:hypothetical protein
MLAAAFTHCVFVLVTMTIAAIKTLLNVALALRHTDYLDLGRSFRLKFKGPLSVISLMPVVFSEPSILENSH